MKMIRVFGLLLILMVPIIFLISCNSSTISEKETSDEKTASEWYNNHEWLNGLKLTPHASINQAEFSRQYHKNSTWWDEAFKFLKTQDLNQLAPGSYVIDSNNVIATVWEGIPKIKDSVLWEAHRNFNDLQYIIRGRAEMGITPIGEADVKITTPYSKEGDIEHFTVDAGEQYYLADSSSFFIFSPKEMHRPTIQVDGDKPIKKVVIKVRVPQ